MTSYIFTLKSIIWHYKANFRRFLNSLPINILAKKPSEYGGLWGMPGVYT